MRTPHDIKAERKRQLVEALLEFLAPAQIYYSLMCSFAELGDAGGVRFAMNNLLACVRAAEITSRELGELCGPEKEGE